MRWSALILVITRSSFKNAPKRLNLIVYVNQVPDGSSYNGKFLIPFALLPPGDNLRITATSSDSTVIITGSPLDFTTPAPQWITI